MAHSVYFVFTLFMQAKGISAVYTNYNRPNKEVMN